MLARALVSPRLVGRQEELAALVERRAASARGHGCFVMIEGEAGIGKSRLVESFCETLTHGRASVGIGHCREFGNAPYGPVAEALEEMGALLPLAPAGTRAEQLRELRSRVVLACARRNRVLILEDIQWADEGTLAFLHYVLSYIGTMRLLVVATCRIDEVLDGHVAPYLTRLARDRGSFRLLLAPLAAIQIRHLIRLALGERRLSGTQIEEIVRRAEGNPFFAEELLTNSIESPRRGAFDGLPQTIRAAVMERIAKLDARAAEIATRASVFGPRFDAEFLAETFGYAAAEVLAGLRQLRDAGLIAEIPTDPPAYCFRHALTREAIYSSMLAAEVRPLHAGILRALEQRERCAPQDLGYHAWAARDAPKCLRYNELAGDRAEEAHAHTDAVRCYELALEGRPAPAARAHLLAKAALSASRDGMAERSTELYDAAASALKGHGTPQQIAEMYYAMGSQARLSGDNQRAMMILDRAVREIPENEVRARALLRITSALMLLDRGETAAADAAIVDAAAAADLPIYQNALGYAALNAADPARFRRANDAYHELCAPLGADQTLRARFNRAFGLCILGIDGEAIAIFDSIVPELQQTRLSSLEILSYANAAIVHARAGRLRLARELVERGLAIPEPTTTGPIALASAGIWIGHALCDGDLVARAASEEIVEAAFASRINTALGRLAGPYARWLDACGNAKAAKSVLARALESLHGPLGATETILAAAELGDAATQAAAFAFIPALQALSRLDLYAATVAHLLAFQSRAAGERGELGLHAAAAAHAYRGLGWPLHEARSLELAGERTAPTERYAAMEAVADLRRIGLSSREREVAALVAEGAANKRIATRLGVSQRTIEKYLTSIYGKLGLRNRSELAAFVGRGTPDSNYSDAYREASSPERSASRVPRLIRRGS
ncbi:MAG TPA: AAA family ATPase [Candidatus Cybelea sp.]|nr:AAA family ATPase [Candidatus Cybelea sp.]